MVDLLQSLIDKQDNFEIIRDQIAAILAAESVNQMALAVTAGEDPALWKLRVFRERSNPWAQFQEREVDDPSPIVNVWYESGTFDGTKGNVVERQQHQGRFNIDIVAYGEAQDEDGEPGHIPGDLDAALNLGRAIRLVRNILMASQNTYLQLPRQVVGRRWPESITSFQPDDSNAKNVAAARIILAVDFNEHSPQYEGEEIETVFAECKESEAGQVLFEVEYDYTAP
jgi:hypothetical protein